MGVWWDMMGLNVHPVLPPLSFITFLPFLFLLCLLKLCLKRCKILGQLPIQTQASDDDCLMNHFRVLEEALKHAKWHHPLATILNSGKVVEKSRPTKLCFISQREILSVWVSSCAQLRRLRVVIKSYELSLVHANFGRWHHENSSCFLDFSFVNNSQSFECCLPGTDSKSTWNLDDPKRKGIIFTTNIQGIGYLSFRVCHVFHPPKNSPIPYVYQNYPSEN